MTVLKKQTFQEYMCEKYPHLAPKLKELPVKVEPGFIDNSPEFDSRFENTAAGPMLWVQHCKENGPTVVGMVDHHYDTLELARLRRKP